MESIGVRRGTAVGHSGEDAGKRTLMLYLDSSALLKLVIAEKESRALRSFLKREAADRVSCSLARTEVLRATRPHGAAALERARGLLQTLQLVQVDDVLLDSAARWTR